MSVPSDNSVADTIPSPRTAAPRRPAFSLAACAAALLLGLAGCSPESGDVSSAGSSSDAASETTISDEEHMAKLLAWELEMAQCFRDKGLDVTDPTPEKGWADITPEMQELSPECQKQIGPAPVRALSAKEKAEGDQMRLEYETKFVGCMRKLGYQMMDPKLGAVAVAPPADAGQADLEQCSTEAAAG